MVRQQPQGERRGREQQPPAEQHPRQTPPLVAAQPLQKHAPAGVAHYEGRPGARPRETRGWKGTRCWATGKEERAATREVWGSGHQTANREAEGAEREAVEGAQATAMKPVEGEEAGEEEGEVGRARRGERDRPSTH